MAVVIPLPDAIKVRDQSFRFMSRSEIARTRGRAVDAKVEPFPYWSADFDLPPMLEEDYGRYESFIMKVRVGGDFFLGYKTNRPRPFMMNTGSPLDGTRGTGGAFDGTAVLNAITDPLNITVTTLPAGFMLIEGDQIELRESNEVRSLHTIGADAVADGTGQIDIVLNNGIPTNAITTAAVVNFEKPSCLMQIVDQPNQSKGVRFGAGSFTAVELPF